MLALRQKPAPSQETPNSQQKNSKHPAKKQQTTSKKRANSQPTTTEQPANSQCWSTVFKSTTGRVSSYMWRKWKHGDLTHFQATLQVVWCAPLSSLHMRAAHLICNDHILDLDLDSTPLEIQPILQSSVQCPVSRCWWLVFWFWCDRGVM